MALREIWVSGIYSDWAIFDPLWHIMTYLHFSVLYSLRIFVSVCSRILVAIHSASMIITALARPRNIFSVVCVKVVRRVNAVVE